MEGLSRNWTLDTFLQKEETRYWLTSSIALGSWKGKAVDLAKLLKATSLKKTIQKTRSLHSFLTGPSS